MIHGGNLKLILHAIYETTVKAKTQIVPLITIGLILLPNLYVS
jgi:hypothetical protein